MRRTPNLVVFRKKVKAIREEGEEMTSAMICLLSVCFARFQSPLNYLNYARMAKHKSFSARETELQNIKGGDWT